MTGTAQTACPTQCQTHCPTHMPDAMRVADARTDGRTDLRRILGYPTQKSHVCERAQGDLNKSAKSEQETAVNHA